MIPDDPIDSDSDDLAINGDLLPLATREALMEIYERNRRANSVPSHTVFHCSSCGLTVWSDGTLTPEPSEESDGT